MRENRLQGDKLGNKIDEDALNASTEMRRSAQENRKHDSQYICQVLLRITHHALLECQHKI